MAQVEPLPLVPATWRIGPARSGWPSAVERALHALQPEAHRQRRERLEVPVRIDHAGAGGAGAQPSSDEDLRQPVAHLRRGTMASIMPCSSRNSERWNPGGSFSRMVCSMTRGPAKPMRALGSAMITSPSQAKEAATPPVVGWSITET